MYIFSITIADAQLYLCHSMPLLPQMFDAKGMAGNIIHAIATTNAIISGLIVVEAIKILAGARASTCFERKGNLRRHTLQHLRKKKHIGMNALCFLHQRWRREIRGSGGW